MNDDRISVIEFAKANGLRKQTVFKVISRLGIMPERSQGDKHHRGQVISYITESESRMILDALASSLSSGAENADELGTPCEASLFDVGVFYLLSLEPEHDPGRFKVGFASNLNERLRQLRCSAPFATVMKTWPCKRLWEKTAIDSVTNGCQQLHTEVFRCQSLQEVVEQCDRFFSIMPTLSVNTQS